MGEPSPLHLVRIYFEYIRKELRAQLAFLGSKTAHAQGIFLWA